jgi:hypothetical protein
VARRHQTRRQQVAALTKITATIIRIDLKPCPKAVTVDEAPLDMREPGQSDPAALPAPDPAKCGDAVTEPSSGPAHRQTTTTACPKIYRPRVPATHLATHTGPGALSGACQRSCASDLVVCHRGRRRLPPGQGPPMSDAPESEGSGEAVHDVDRDVEPLMEPLMEPLTSRALHCQPRTGG